MNSITQLLGVAKNRINKKIEKITICSSLCFSKEIGQITKQLNDLGCKVYIPASAQNMEADPNLKLNENLEYCLNNNVQMAHFKKIQDSDAILVLNLEKNGIKNYIGGAVLMEMAIAKFLHKKIFLFNELPDEKDQRIAFEARLTEPVVINRDLNKILCYSFI